jgi:hypothetical protein
MARREQRRPKGARCGDMGGAPDPDPRADQLPRRPRADTREAAQLLERIRRVLNEGRPH